MKLKRLRISIKSLLIVFGSACFVLIVAGWFYWFQYRPFNIRRRCVVRVDELIEKEKYNLFDANWFYQRCLAFHGLKPEVLMIK